MPAACTGLFGLFLLLSLYRTIRPLRLVITPTRVLVGGSEIASHDARRRRSIGTEEELDRLHRLPSLAGRT